MFRYSVDSEEARERKALKKQIKEKESQYMARLKKWEAREKLHAKQYEREERKEKESYVLPHTFFEFCDFLGLLPQFHCVTISIKPLLRRCVPFCI